MYLTKEEEPNDSPSEEIMEELPESFKSSFNNEVMQGVLGADDDSPFGLKQTLMKHQTLRSLVRKL